MGITEVEKRHDRNQIEQEISEERDKFSEKNVRNSRKKEKGAKRGIGRKRRRGRKKNCDEQIQDKPKMRKKAEGKGKFVDAIKLVVRGGSGGMGLPKLKGVGGKGGSVYLEAEKGATLKRVYHAFSKGVVAAQSGESSRVMRIFGQSGRDKIVKVPVGVTVYDEYMRKVGELNNLGEKLIVAEGGPGGSPKSFPPFSGSKGYSQVITIELKLIADVGLVGFPNAGKSTLLKAVSKADPKIAAYAFTTLAPKIGVIEYPDFRQIKMADLPGLIEGASCNLGMGHKFLKHVERSRLLLMIVDINGFQLTPMNQHWSCLESVFILNKELELFNKELVQKPAILAVNKMDLPGALSAYETIVPYLENLSEYSSRLPEKIRPEKLLNFDCIVPISAKSDTESIEKLKKIIRESMDRHFEFSVEDEMRKQEMNLLKKIRLQSTELTKVKV